MTGSTWKYITVAIFFCHWCVIHIAAGNSMTKRKTTKLPPVFQRKRNVSVSFNTTENSLMPQLSEKELKLQEIQRRYDADKLCNKTWFLDNYLKYERYVNIDDMRRLCNNTHFHQCQGVAPGHELWYQLMEVVKNQTYFLRINLKRINTNRTGCWGYAFETVTVDDKEIFYFNFDDNKVNAKYFDIHYKVGMNYTFRIGALPSGAIFEFDWESPGRCELEILHDMYRRLVEKKLFYNRCSQDMDYTDQFTFAKTLCLLYEPDERRMMLKEQLDFENNCTPFLVGPKDKEDATNITTKISLSISALLLVSAVIVFVFLAKWNRLKFCEGHKMMHYDLNDQNLDTKSAKPKEPTSVAIIHRPGCDFLELIVVELLGLLKSYGIDVRMTLLEQTLPDPAGGLVYHMQKNIQGCDFVLVLLTEPTGANSLQTHRPFDFAIAMMQGLAVHNNSYSKYIPLYLTTYYEAVKYFPPFLNANTSYGYQLPQESIRLVARMLGTSSLKQSKEREIKDKQFLGRMKELTKAYHQTRHSNCINSNCKKGAQYPSTSNLSSIWPSTIDTKWPSFKSLATQEDMYSMEYEPDVLTSPPSLDVLSSDEDECVPFVETNPESTVKCDVEHVT